MKVAGFLFFIFMRMEERSSTSRIQELDVLRVVAMLFVITYHFGCEYSAQGIPFFNILFQTSNYDFGNIAVTIFIALSGGLLYKKYKSVSCGDLKAFYVKRVKAIYPPFWILSLYIPLTMLRHLLTDGNVFFMGNPTKLLLTVIGFDGYVKMYGVETYAFCGDWFVGAIVLLYLLYPLLAAAYRRHPAILLLAATAAYAMQFLIPESYGLVLSVLPFTLALKFCLGFAIIENLDRFKDKRVILAAVIVFAVLSLVNIPGSLNTDFFGMVAAFALFVALFGIAPQLLKSPKASTVINKVAVLSYCVFLVQHVGIIWTQAAFVKIFEKLHWDFSAWKVAALLVFTLAIISVAAWILKLVSDRVVKALSPKLPAN